jgi:hypothetical protein
MNRLLGVVLLVAVTTAPLDAQGKRIPSRVIMAGVGALVAGGMAGVYAANFERDIGGCSKATCVVPVSVVLGGLMGYLIGGEMDKLYALRYSHAPPIGVRGRELTLTVLPNDVFVQDGTVLVTGVEGVEVVRAGPRLERLGFRARGLRGIGPVSANDASNRLLVGSSVGLYQFPLRGDELGTLAYPGEISAVSADGAWLALGLGPAVQLARITDSLRAAGPQVEEEARVVALRWRGDTQLWVLTEERLAAYAREGDSLRVLGALALPTLARRLSLTDSLALVSAGSGGVFVIDIRDPAAPVEVTNWSGARFAYDAAILDDVVYVAAGPEGLYILRLTDHRLVPVGLSRGVGFIAAIAAGPDAIYLLDRNGAALRRIDPLRQ